MAISKKDVFSLFWILGLVFFLRAYVFEPFQIPTGSMIPTLLIGDHLLVAKSAYDIKVPFKKSSLLKISDPQPGDVIVFDYPNYEMDKRKEGYFYIKRVIGVPKDTIRIHKQSLYRNASLVPSVKITQDDKRANSIPNFKPFPHAELFEEKLSDHSTHWIQKYTATQDRFFEDLIRFKRDQNLDCLTVGDFIKNQRLAFYRSIAANEVCEFSVPENSYFVMGDNRDDSEDGRFWGFVKRDQIRGKALSVFMALGKGGLIDSSQSHNLDPEAEYFSWKRFGLKIR